MAKPKKMTLEKLWQESDAVKRPMEEMFEVKCKACGSTDVYLAHETRVEEGFRYSEHTAEHGYARFYLALKCKSCGQAKVVEAPEHYISAPES